ncbi:MAG TPA: nuclease A inhibitor family protein [Nodosilinea sp.]|nr:nuclease A inhibitor family protein [Nodosilinea sp.]
MDLEPEHYELGICLSALEGALGGLWYPSETDALLSLVIYADPMPSPEAVGEKLRAGAEQLTILPAAAFFRPVLHNPYWASEQGGHLAQKFANLRDVLDTHLEDLHTYRVGEGNVTLYLLGRHATGCYVGVCTHAVET